MAILGETVIHGWSLTVGRVMSVASEELRRHPFLLPGSSRRSCQRFHNHRHTTFAQQQQQRFHPENLSQNIHIGKNSNFII